MPLTLIADLFNEQTRDVLTDLVQDEQTVLYQVWVSDTSECTCIEDDEAHEGDCDPRVVEYLNCYVSLTVAHDEQNHRIKANWAMPLEIALDRPGVFRSNVQRTWEEIVFHDTAAHQMADLDIEMDKIISGGDG